MSKVVNALRVWSLWMSDMVVSGSWEETYCQGKSNECT